jgi:histidyl-tRNA synthetase
VRTAFEIVSGDLGAQNALAGGGRYDGLSEVLGGPPLHGFGFAMGLDRLVMILPDDVALAKGRGPALFCAYLGEAAFHRSVAICRTLRRAGITCQMEFEAGSLRSQMRLADKLEARHVLIIGDDELARERYSIRRLKDSVQWEVTLDELETHLRDSERS